MPTVHAFVGALLLVVPSATAGQGGGRPEAARMPLELRKATLRVGDFAPDFALDDVTGKATVRLSKLKSKPVVLIFGSCT